MLSDSDLLYMIYNSVKVNNNCHPRATSLRANFEVASATLVHRFLLTHHEKQGIYFIIIIIIIILRRQWLRSEYMLFLFYI